MVAFQVMYEELKAEGESTGLMAIKQTEYYVNAGKHLKIFEEYPDVRCVHSSGSLLAEMLCSFMLNNLH